MNPFHALTAPLQGTHIVEASAGTGKTYAITTLYVRLVVEQRLSVRNILVVSYTRAATSELRDRLRARLRQVLLALESDQNSGDSTIDQFVQARRRNDQVIADQAVLATAIRTFDQAAIYTIHGFCQHVLQDSAFESGTPFDIDFVTDQSALLSDIGDDYWARELYREDHHHVNYLLRTKKNPITRSRISEIIELATRNPAIPILPEITTTQSALADWQRYQEKARELWHTDKKLILDLLTGTATSGTYYKKTSVLGPWARSMDFTLKATTIGISSDFTKPFTRFTTVGLASGCKRNHSPPNHMFFELCDGLYEADQRLNHVKTEFVVKLGHYARDELNRRKRDSGIQSFDDLLLGLDEALTSSNGKALATTIRHRFPAALVDEFQDTDPVQYRVFKTIYQSHSNPHALFLIGDPKQAIYGFRGADIFAYLNARKDSGEHIHTLGINWRSDPRYIRAVNTLFERKNRAFVYDDIEFHPVLKSPTATNRVGGILSNVPALDICFTDRTDLAKKGKTITKAWANQQIPVDVAHQIARLLASDATIAEAAISPRDIAILVRTNQQAHRCQVALRSLGVPSVVESDASVFDTEEALDLMRVLAAIVVPNDSRRWTAAWTSNLLGLSGDQACALQASEAQLNTWVRNFRKWHTTWVERGFIQAFRQLLHDSDVAQRILAYRGGERALTNFYHLGELLQAQSASAPQSPQTLFRWLCRLCWNDRARAGAVGDTGQIRLESDDDAVKIVTIHKSKGLEYPVVFCPFLWEGTLPSARRPAAFCFHDADDDNRRKLDVGSENIDEHLRFADTNALAESLRLLYVALTRARHRCCISWGAFATSERSALGYLLHGPQTGPVSLPDLFSTIKEKDDNQMLEELQHLVTASNGSISVRHYSPLPGSPYQKLAVSRSTLVAQKARRSHHNPKRFSSFSALVYQAFDDSQQHTPADRQPTLHGELPSLATAPPPEDGSRIRLAEFPRGRQIGNMFHRAFERTDFSTARTTPLYDVASEALSHFGCDITNSELVSEAIHDTITTSLSCPATDSPMRLLEIPTQDRLNEMEFLFPTAGRSGAVTATKLATILESYREAPWPDQYPSEVAKLEFVPLHGFMKGFIDLIFRRDDRWYIADYKSTFLGKNTTDYQPAPLSRHMAENHYYLQYLIYVVALHRYLQSRLPSYSYEENIGGIYYLFLRGMSPAYPPGTGVFSHLPPFPLVEGLSMLFAAT